MIVKSPVTEDVYFNERRMDDGFGDATRNMAADYKATLPSIFSYADANIKDRPVTMQTANSRQVSSSKHDRVEHISTFAPP